MSLVFLVELAVQFELGRIREACCMQARAQHIQTPMATGSQSLAGPSHRWVIPEPPSLPKDGNPGNMPSGAMPTSINSGPSSSRRSGLARKRSALIGISDEAKLQLTGIIDKLPSAYSNVVQAKIPLRSVRTELNSVQVRVGVGAYGYPLLKNIFAPPHS